MSARDELVEVIAAGYGTDESPCPYDHAPAIADAILAAGYSKPKVIGYAVVGKSSDSLDWDDTLYPSEDACIDSLCGPYQDFTREPDSASYWGKEYKLCPVVAPEATL